jgi:putative flippase GtrA
MHIDRKGVIRFFKYGTVGVSTFLLDILLLYIFVNVLGFTYLFATALAFLMAVSVNYVISRKLVFQRTETAHKEGYRAFIGVALASALFIVLAMYVLVDILGTNYLLARTLISSLVGAGNYSYHLYITFKVSGKH